MGCDPCAVSTVNLHARINRRKRDLKEAEQKAAVISHVTGKPVEDESSFIQDDEQLEHDNRAKEYADIRLYFPKWEPRKLRTIEESKPYVDISHLIARAAKDLYYKLGEGKGYFVKGRKDKVRDQYQITVLQAEKEIGAIRLKYMVPHERFDEYECYIEKPLDRFYAWLTMEPKKI